MKTALTFLICSSSLHAATLYRANLRPDQVVPVNDGISPAGISNAWAEARLELHLTPGNPRMTYEITFHNLALSEITGVHFHFGHDPSLIPVAALALSIPSVDFPPLNHEGASGPNGPHLLNVFQLPREDDADLIVDPIGNKLSGIWDNSDFNFGPDGVREPGDSVAIGSAISIILAEEVYIQVHSNAFPSPNTGELRGQVVLAPEPNTILLAALAGVGFLSLRRRNKCLKFSQSGSIPRKER